MSRGVLLVDDDELVRNAVARYLRLKHWDVLEAADLREAGERLRERRPDAAVVDYSLPDGSGLELVRRIHELEPTVPIVVLTAHGTIDLAVAAVKEGAEQFFTKPVDLRVLEVVLARATENSRSREARKTERELADREAIDPFLGESRSIATLREQVERLLGSPRPLLLQGETGSGKGVLARWIHRHGPRNEAPFVDLNCAGLGRELLESELFGYEKGAFTGAVASKQGLLEAADRGSLFLDEIGDLLLEVQPKLLTVLEEQRFRRLGSVRERMVDVRLIVATHQDLSELVATGRFRADLLYRIATLPLKVPPLRERGRDVILLARATLSRIAREVGRPYLELDAGAEATLLAHAWPGNVRELRNVLEHAALFADGGTIGCEHLFLGGGTPAAPHRARTLQDAERQHIAAILRETGGDVVRAAAILDLSRSALYERMRRLALSASGEVARGKPGRAGS
jgi:DNA-binding NtrC family response regulator